MRCLLVFLVLLGISGQVSAVKIGDFLATSSKASSIEVTGIQAKQGPVRLELKAFEPVAADARFVLMVDGKEQALPRPKSRFYRGHAVGAVTGRTYVAVHADDFFAVVDSPDGPMLIQREGTAYVLAEAKRTKAASDTFQCAVDQHPALNSLLEDPAVDELAARVPEGVLYNARLAIETDQEYLARFSGNVTNATNYVNTLIGYISSVYGAQVDTSIQVSFARLWSTTDPWVQTDPGCMLLEFGKYWNDNMSSETRTMVHMLSGKSTTAGIAWIGVLCSGAFNSSPAAIGTTCPGITGTSNFGGAYGVTSGIAGNFNANTQSIVWDSYAVTHELGHNFNSPHTHCYGNIGGNADQVDHCYNGEVGNTGCWAGAQALPGGAGSGTIMSYCHLLSGGFSNVSMTFGEGHAFGTAPERVNQRMRAHVQSRATAFPSCLALPASSVIFLNGFE